MDKKKLIFFGLFVILLLFIILIFNIEYQKENLKPENTLNSSSNIPISLIQRLVGLIPKEMISVDSFYVIATNFESSLSDLSTHNSSINNYEIYSIKNRLSTEVCKLVDFCGSIIYLDNYEGVVDKLRLNANSIAILELESLDFRLKVLTYNGISLWENSDAYELKVTEKYDKIGQKSDLESYSNNELVRVGHTGSFIPARGVMLHTNRKFGGNLEPMIDPMKEYFSRFDILSSTQEISLLGEGIYCDTCMSFLGSEKQIPQMVIPLGIDVLSMAANHVLDGGFEALGNTINKLKERNIKVIGASVINNEEALEPVLIEEKGLKIAYVAINDTPGIEQWAKENRGGTANISDWIVENGVTISYEPNVERIKRVMIKAKSLDPDFIIILPHWGGVEYQRVPTNYTKRLAELLFAEGADIIIGDHPHWIQQIGWQKNENVSYSGLKFSPIFYSVGNFVFDQMWSEETRYGMTVELIFYNKSLKAINLGLHQLNLYESGTVAPIVDKTHYNKIMQSIFEVSEL